MATKSFKKRNLVQFDVLLCAQIVWPQVISGNCAFQSQRKTGRNVPISRIALYATRMSPIMHLICPLPLPPPPLPTQKKITYALFSISLGTAVIPRRNEKQRLCKNFGGQIRCIIADAQVAYGTVLKTPALL